MRPCDEYHKQHAVVPLLNVLVSLSFVWICCGLGTLGSESKRSVDFSPEEQHNGISATDFAGR